MRALKIFLMSALLVLFLITPTFAKQNDSQDRDYYAEQYEASGADKLKDSLPDDVRSYMETAGLDDIDFYALFEASPKKIVELFWNIASGNVRNPLKGLAEVMGVIAICAIVKSLLPVDEKLDEIMTVVAGAAVAVGVFAPLSDVITRGVSAVSAGADFMLALVPVMAGIITASGNPTLAASYNTLTFAAAQGVAALARSTLLPLAGTYTAVGVISSLSAELKLDKLTDLIKKAAFGILSFAAAMFSAVLSLKSIMAVSADSLVSRGIKLAVSSAVPVVGGAISDAYSSIVGSLSLLKSAVGVFGIVAVAVINLPVVAELLAWTVCFRLAWAFASMLGEDRVSDMLEVVASVLVLINVTVIFGAVIFIISIGIIISLRTAV